MEQRTNEIYPKTKLMKQEKKSGERQRQKNKEAQYLQIHATQKYLRNPHLGHMICMIYSYCMI